MSPSTLSKLFAIAALSIAIANAQDPAPPASPSTQAPATTTAASSTSSGTTAPAVSTTAPPTQTTPAAATAPTSSAVSTYPAVPLADKRFTYPGGIPYKVDTDVGLIRGTQHGYNQCNSTTEGPQSLCQTSFINSIDDFCLWAPDKPGSVVANTEGEMVAWCTKPGRGTRLIPQYALQGVQFMKTPNYVQVAGFIDQELINIDSADYGGEMDPHGADLRGNPMGGLIYSQSFSDAKEWLQVVEWHNFMGGNAFCLKACDPTKPDDEKYCEHKLDRIGCAYNAPNNARNGTFESCEGENQDFPGVYTTNGQVMTYTQPPEDAGPITSMPYTARIPASSNCVTYTSSAIYTGLPTPTVRANAAGSSGSPSKSGSAAGSKGTDRNAASSMVAITGLSFLGVVVSALLLA